MNLQDSIRSMIGITGTAGSMVLQNAESSAAIFAGISTGIFMLVSAAMKLRNPKDK